MRVRRRILAMVGLVAFGFCVIVALQAASIVPPIGFSWGDAHGLHGGTAYSLGFDGEIMFETLSGVRPMPGGSVLGVKVDESGFLGIGVRRNTLLAQHEPPSFPGPRTTLPGTYGTQSRFYISAGWLLVLCLATGGRYVVLQRRDRRRAMEGFCKQCGYDLRATPDRCPECGAVPSAMTSPRDTLFAP